MRKCAVCSNEFEPTGKKGRHYSYCSDCKTQRRKRDWKNNKDHIAFVNKLSRLKVQYGLSKEDYFEMLKKQDNKCAICGLYREKKTKPPLSVDHDHKTGKVRGLLCQSCNTAIGHLDEDIRILMSAVNYINTSKNKN